MNHFNGQMESRTDLTLSAIWIDQGIFTYPKVTMYCITQQNSCWLVPVLLLQWSHRAKHGNQFSQKEMMLVHKVTSLFSFQYFMFMSTKLRFINFQQHRSGFYIYNLTNCFNIVTELVRRVQNTFKTANKCYKFNA